MIRKASTWPLVCARCLIPRGYVQKRLQATAATTQSGHPRLVPLDLGAPGASHDDQTIRKVFDDRNFWKDFLQNSNIKLSRRSIGLFQNRYLTSPEGFEVFANANLRKAKKIVGKVLGASSVEEFRTVARDLDRLSDMLCRVIDLSDFVQSTHPDRKTQMAASRAHAMMFEYMNVLNTTTGLNDQLGVAMANPDIMSNWTEEEKVVAQSLKKDFAKSAIALPKAVREKFVSLSQEILDAGQAFLQKMEPAQPEFTIPASQLKGLDPILIRRITSWGKAKVPTAGGIAADALGSVQNEDTRRDIFMANRTASKKQISELHELLRKRAELATLTGYDSYAQSILGDKMARSSQSVNQFLLALSGGNRPGAEYEMDGLIRAKMRDPDASSLVFQPWDKYYYISQIRASMRSTLRNSDILSSYFSLGTVMQGLSRVFTRLYGIRFVPRETMPGETWNQDVRRLDVISETDGHVAVLYCDLFSRPGKSPNPAHFTLRCSREIADEELTEAQLSPNYLFNTPEEDVNDGMATSRASGKLKQLPTIALICDFQTSLKPSLLAFGEVQTLFHEMGHAIHSILGRTSLHEVSGTRCPTDFAELPSILMEHFAADPAVLSLFARHYETDHSLPYEMVAEKLALDRQFSGCDTENQIILALVDQAYHSSLPASPSFDSTQLFHEMQRKYGVSPPDPPGTCWQGLFGHLVGYGSTYYSYLFDQVLAERIWRVVFKSGQGGASIDRVNGEKMKERVLRWGGGRDPWRCVADVLDDDRVRDGDERAMAIVGNWWTAKDRQS